MNFCSDDVRFLASRFSLLKISWSLALSRFISICFFIISIVWIHWVYPYQVCEIALVNIIPSFGCVFDCAVQCFVILLADFYLEPFICDPVESVWVCFVSHSFIFQRFKKNTLQNRTISGPSPERSTRIAAVNAAPPVIHNHALSSNKPKSSIMSFSFCIFSLITLISITDF